MSRSLERFLTWTTRAVLFVIFVVGMLSLAGLVHGQTSAPEFTRGKIVAINGFCTNDEKGHRDARQLEGILKAQDFGEYARFMSSHGTSCLSLPLAGLPDLPGVVQTVLGEFRVNSGRCYKWVVVRHPTAYEQTILTWMKCKDLYGEDQGA